MAGTRPAGWGVQVPHSVAIVWLALRWWASTSPSKAARLSQIESWPVGILADYARLVSFTPKSDLVIARKRMKEVSDAQD